MIVKVCGMRDPENIRAVENLHPYVQWMGFIFWQKSSRYVSEKPAYLPTKLKRVGVFVDATIDEVREKAEEFALDLIQLHGKETPDYIRQLGKHSIIKALNIATAEDIKQTEGYEGIVDYFLFDTKAKMVGGNGTKFDWSALDAYHSNTPFILSGGIGPEDAQKVKAFRHPRLAGIDLNSRFETAPALKNINQLKQFIYEQNQ